MKNILSLFLLLLLSNVSGENFSSLYKSVSKSTCLINVDKGHGSGFQISNGYIVTAAHVVTGTEKCTVLFPDGELFTTSEYVYYDSIKDIAIIKIPQNHAGVVSLANKLPDIGEDSFTIGTPMYFNLFSAGHISGIVNKNYMQIVFTSPISPGCSGGPLFNRSGQIIGISCAHYIDAENINIATSSLEIPKNYKSLSIHNFRWFYQVLPSDILGKCLKLIAEIHDHNYKPILT